MHGADCCARTCTLLSVGVQLHRMPTAADVDVTAVIRATAGFSGAECVSVVREAAMAALSESFDAAVVCQRHLVAAAGRVVPQITAEMIRFYDGFRAGKGSV